RVLATRRAATPYDEKNPPRNVLSEQYMITPHMAVVNLVRKRYGYWLNLMLTLVEPKQEWLKEHNKKAPLLIKWINDTKSFFYLYDVSNDEIKLTELKSIDQLEKVDF